jgi:hypothetical protein
MTSQRWMSLLSAGMAQVKEDVGASSGGFVVEITDGEHAIDAVHEVFLLQLEHVHRQLAGEDLAAGVGDEFEELAHRRDVEFLHLLVHEMGGKGGDAGHRAHPGGEGHRHGQAEHRHGHVQRGVAHGGDLEVVEGLVGEGVQAEEGEEERGLDALHAGTIGHDQGGVNAVERAPAHDDGHLFHGLFVGHKCS